MARGRGSSDSAAELVHRGGHCGVVRARAVKISVDLWKTEFWAIFHDAPPHRQILCSQPAFCLQSAFEILERVAPLAWHMIQPPGGALLWRLLVCVSCHVTTLGDELSGHGSALTVQPYTSGRPPGETVAIWQRVGHSHDQCDWWRVKFG